MTPNKIFFVGVHFKKGMDALDSSTKSGKLIDAVIKYAPKNEYVKTNLFNTDYLPQKDNREKYVLDWASKNNYNNKKDIIFALGAIVQNEMINHFDIICVKHPASIWSNKSKQEYIDNIISKLATLKK
jgi:hypothetical protein